MDWMTDTLTIPHLGHVVTPPNTRPPKYLNGHYRRLQLGLYLAHPAQQIGWAIIISPARRKGYLKTEGWPYRTATRVIPNLDDRRRRCGCDGGGRGIGGDRPRLRQHLSELGLGKPRPGQVTRRAPRAPAESNRNGVYDRLQVAVACKRRPTVAIPNAPGGAGDCTRLGKPVRRAQHHSGIHEGPPHRDETIYRCSPLPGRWEGRFPTATPGVTVPKMGFWFPGGSVS